jgi:hypothetical protein
MTGEVYFSQTARRSEPDVAVEPANQRNPAVGGVAALLSETGFSRQKQAALTRGVQFRPCQRAPVPALAGGRFRKSAEAAPLAIIPTEATAG